MRQYSAPTAEVSLFSIERGFCVSLEFTPEVLNPNSTGGLGIDNMTENSDNTAW